MTADEWKLQALRAQHGLQMIERDKSSRRELRSIGRENVWLCMMGRRALDGDFASFQAKVAALPVKFDGLKITPQTMRGEELRFGWNGPLLLNGKEQTISDFPHFDNPTFKQRGLRRR